MHHPIHLPGRASVSHAAGELLKLGADVEVLAPVALRERMQATLTEMAELYAGSKRSRGKS